MAKGFKQGFIMNNKPTSNKTIDISHLSRVAVILLADLIAVAVSFFLAIMLCYNFNYDTIPSDFLLGYISVTVFWMISSVVVFFFAKLYNSIWVYVGINELFRIFASYAVLLVIGIVYLIIIGASMPLAFYCVGYLLCFLFTIAIRFGYRFMRRVTSMAFGEKKAGVERIMIVGAGSAGRMLIREYHSSEFLNGKVVCLIDDKQSKQGRILEGVSVEGTSEDIPRLAAKYEIDRIVVAIPSASGSNRKRILELCNSTGAKIQTLPGIYQLVNGDVSVSDLKDVDVVDLLGRDPISVNEKEIFASLFGKTIMVTGGGGSIGSELCMQIASAKPKLLILFDIYENNAYSCQQEILRHIPDCPLKVLIGSVRDKKRLLSVMHQYKPDIVFHAAAHKHVPLMEDSPCEAIKNNVFGTFKTAEAAEECGVKKFVLISTDKAVNPTNIMGASKRLCEMIIQMKSRSSQTEFVAVRFGNVLGSNGSVIPLFKKQIKEGGPVTVTHPDIIRYFMTIPEAVSLILQAAYYAKGGEIFVLDMGDPVKIDDMARNLIRLSGHVPDEDIKIIYTGLRPGEKLYEELLMNEEGLKETENKLIYVGQPIIFDDVAFSANLEKLAEAAHDESTVDAMKQLVSELVPTYSPQI